MPEGSKSSDAQETARPDVKRWWHLKTGQTLGTLVEIFGKTVSHELTNLDHFKDNDYSMAITVLVE
jgi:hypothetical protein